MFYFVLLISFYYVFAKDICFVIRAKSTTTLTNIYHEKKVELDKYN